eukprot:8150012-Alexandrium_andersonii.AAC.1
MIPQPLSVTGDEGGVGARDLARRIQHQDVLIWPSGHEVRPRARWHAHPTLVRVAALEVARR